MKNSKKKNIVLASSTNIHDKLNKNNLLVNTRKKSLLIDSNKSIINNFSLIKGNSSKRTDHSETKEMGDEKKSLLNTLLNNTNLDNLSSEGLKTAQINVVARFRPVNFVEDVNRK